MKLHGVHPGCLALFEESSLRTTPVSITPAAPRLETLRAASLAASQKKPRLRGVSVACLCVEECRSRCYPVMRYPASNVSFRIRTYSFIPWRLYSFPGLSRIWV